MLEQTVDKLIPLLQMLPQPAFCLRDDGTIAHNAAARHLLPGSHGAFSSWLGDSAPLYHNWDGHGTLEVPVHAGGLFFQASLRRVEDGLLCMLIPCDPPDAAALALTVTAQVLRQPLADLSGQLQYLESQLQDDACFSQTAAMQRQLYRISRIAANLSDLEQLRSGAWRRKISRLDVPTDLGAFLTEVRDLCREMKREFLWKAPSKTVFLSADPDLLKRALLNLISNALKYSPEGTPVAMRPLLTDTHLIFQVDNLCEAEALAPLYSAFHRLEQRNLLPDARWGVGLGLPIAQAIARLHGGTVALELKKHTVTVSLSLRRLPAGSTAALHSPQMSYTGGMSQSLMELSDVLPNRLYHSDCV